MTKADLIEAIASGADISKVAAGRALDAFVDAVSKDLRRGGSVTIVGFGTFLVRKRAARMGRNPSTGASIKIKASKVPAFKPGKNLKDQLN